MADTSKNKHRNDPTRRRVLFASGAGVAAAGLGGAYLTTNASAGETPSTDAPTSSASAGEECLTLTQETVEGPYYIDYDKYRQDITEGEVGVPLTLRIKVIDSESCLPLEAVAVDVWHCTAMGVYSSYEAASAAGSTPPTDTPSGTPTDGSAEGSTGGSTEGSAEGSTGGSTDGPTVLADVPTGGSTDVPTEGSTGAPTGAPGVGGGHSEPDSDTTYLRGFQMTDEEGYVTFTTIFPGWYRGRAVHIHTKVHVDGTFADGVYDGGTDCHTGQLYFSESAIEDLTAVDPYSTNTTERTTNATDPIYTGDTVADGMLELTYENEQDISEGLTATITVAVDPDAVNTGQDTATVPSASATPFSS